MAVVVGVVHFDEALGSHTLLEGPLEMYLMQSDTRLPGRRIRPPTCHRQLSFGLNTHTYIPLLFGGHGPTRVIERPSDTNQTTSQ